MPPVPLSGADATFPPQKLTSDPSSQKAARPPKTTSMNAHTHRRKLKDGRPQMATKASKIILFSKKDAKAEKTINPKTMKAPHPNPKRIKNSKTNNENN